MSINCYYYFELKQLLRPKIHYKTLRVSFIHKDLSIRFSQKLITF